MTVIHDERDSKYYALVLKKGEGEYASWINNGMSSKQLVEKANEFLFDNRLKTDFAFRLRVLIFACALQIRMDKRYRGFWRKLIRLFAYLRERSALKMLKRAWGFAQTASLFEIIVEEFKKAADYLSQLKDRKTTGGGMIAQLTDPFAEIELDEYIEKVFEEVENIRKNEFKNKIGLEKKTNVEIKGNKPIEKTSEKKVAPTPLVISNDNKTPTAENKTPEKTSEVKKEVISGKKQESKTTTKSLTDNGFILEMMPQDKEKEEEISPFPVFRERIDEVNLSAKPTSQSENVKQTTTKETVENVNKDVKETTVKQDSPFPIFRQNGGRVIPVEEKKPENKVKPLGKPTRERVSVRVSEENQMRRDSNIKMSEKQINVIASQRQEFANIILAQEENAWKESIALENNANPNEPSVKVDENNNKDEIVIQNPIKK